MNEKETTENLILNAAYEVFIEKGMNDAKMQDIADKAGIKRTVVNYYFRTKEKLFYKIGSRIMHQGMPDMMQILNGDLPLFEKIEVFIEDYMTKMSISPFMPLFLVTEINKMDSDFLEAIVAQVKPNINGFKKQVAQEVQLGNIVSVDPIQLYMNIMSLCSFPILARPLFMMFTDTEEQDMNKLMNERIHLVSQMIIKSIKK